MELSPIGLGTNGEHPSERHKSKGHFTPLTRALPTVGKGLEDNGGPNLVTSLHALFGDP